MLLSDSGRKTAADDLAGVILRGEKERSVLDWARMLWIRRQGTGRKGRGQGTFVLESQRTASR